MILLYSVWEFLIKLNNFKLMFAKLVLIGTGGFAGSVFRYLSFSLMTNYLKLASFIGTLTVNLLGSFLIGAFLGITFHNNNVSDNLKFIFVLGFCGGFTTFSTFSVENFEMFRSGKIGLALMYSISSFIFGVLFVYLGYLLFKNSNLQ